MKNPIYSIGDNVKIIKYGSIIWENKSMAKDEPSFPVVNEDDNFRWVDIQPNLIGKEGIIEKVSNSQGTPTYAIYGIPGKYAWYNEDQLELIQIKDNF